MARRGIAGCAVRDLRGAPDDRVQTFLNRPLEGDWPFVWLDATYVKVRQDGRIISVAAIITIGVNTDVRFLVKPCFAFRRQREQCLREMHEEPGLGIGPVGGRDILDGLPAHAHASRAARREAGDRRGAFRA